MVRPYDRMYDYDEKEIEAALSRHKGANYPPVCVRLLDGRRISFRVSCFGRKFLRARAKEKGITVNALVADWYEDPGFSEAVERIANAIFEGVPTQQQQRQQKKRWGGAERATGLLAPPQNFFLNDLDFYILLHAWMEWCKISERRRQEWQREWDQLMSQVRGEIDGKTRQSE